MSRNNTGQFFFHVWVSSKWSFAASIDAITIIVSGNHIVFCPLFYDNCLLTFYSVYCNSCALRNNNGTFCWTCPLSNPLVPEMFFWIDKIQKKFEFFEMYTFLWAGAHVMFKQNWRNFYTGSLLLHCFDEQNCFGCWNELFSSVFLEFFSYWTFTKTFEIGFQNWFAYK